MHVRSYEESRKEGAAASGDHGFGDARVGVVSVLVYGCFSAIPGLCSAPYGVVEMNVTRVTNIFVRRFYLIMQILP